MAVNNVSRAKKKAWLAQHAAGYYLYRRDEAHERVYMDRQPAHEVPADAKREFYDFTRATIGDVPLVYLEFGVGNGSSISQMAERFGHPEARFFGFDSFEGLPEDWVCRRQTWSRGTFSTGGRVPVTSDTRMSFVKGWFQNTLPAFLDGKRGEFNGPVLVHYDADLYSSTLFILSTLWHYIDEYHLIFDEILEHEMIALSDFSQAFPVDIEFLCQMNAGYPFKMFGRMRRVPFTLAPPKIEAPKKFDADQMLFDEEWYLQHNPDVARAVAEGRCTAVEHYLARGRTEGRLPAPPDGGIKNRT